MKAYDLTTRFTFGKYEGKTLDEVFQKDPAYIDKCLITVEDFAIDEKCIQKLFEKYPDIDLSDEAIDTNLDKLDAIDMDDDDLVFDDEVYEDDFDGFEEDAPGKVSGKKGRLDSDDEFDSFDEDDLFDDSEDFEDEWGDDDDDF